MKKRKIIFLALLLLISFIVFPSLCFAEGDQDNDTGTGSPINGREYLNGYIPTSFKFGDINNTQYYLMAEAWADWYGSSDYNQLLYLR
ncbi:hypothetical protein F9B85_06405 [Heliorestis acidaminivorans]|uniref:Uncharacterized protein n=1 Tax=Heliorestis acidaminivorans TaxID=553427 RepID=A0A6I0EX94_9FIRM|nr:hypothetical protein [Heliorestis acidaminivorans]KAB2952900.1 hypothetical protein F9B85_06405 [Heliorestis acidaminivorans]